MKQYMLAVHNDPSAPTPSDQDMQRMFAQVDAINNDIRTSGAWVFAGGLEPIEAATTVDGTGAESVITDGPFSETKEYLGGFWVIKVADLDAALEWAGKASAACEALVEVRPFGDEPEA